MDMTSEEREMALLLLRVAADDGGRIDPRRIASRPVESDARKAFGYCLTHGWVDHDGWLTAIGREVLS